MENIEPKKHKNISVFYINIQCLHNKILELNMFLSGHDYDILCFSETWSREDQACHIHINNYELATYYSRSNFIHGGVAIYVKTGVEFKPCEFSNDYCDELNFEICAIELRKTKSIIGCCYRSPTGDINIFNSKLISFLDNVPMNNRITVIGDFNVDFSLKRNKSQQISNIFLSFGMHECVNEFTRVTNTSATRIDNIFTNIDDIYHITKIFNPDLSDHKSLSFTYKGLDKCNIIKASSTYRVVNESNKENYKISLSCCNWSHFFQTNNVNEMSDILLDNIINCHDSSFPIKTSNKRSKNIIYSENIKRMKNTNNVT